MIRIRDIKPILLLFFLMSSSFCKADNFSNNPSQPEKEAYNLLLHDETFCFSGLGESGIPSPEIGAMKTILASTHAKEQLISLYDEGSTIAKLYALIGIWHLNKEEFSSRAEKINKEDSAVPEISGCNPRPIPKRVADILAAIKGNVFEWHLKNHQ